MTAYEAVKTAHILSATLIFGTGLGTAFYMWRGYLTADAGAFLVIARNVVLADWLFTTPAIVFQAASGAWLVLEAGFAFSETWLLWTYGLFLLAGFCWLPVVWLQVHVRDLLAAGGDRAAIRAYMTFWFALGWPAFLAVIAIFFLMVVKP